MALKDNLIACYEMNETSGTTCNDAHTGALHGTVTGSVTINQTGILDKAYSFPNSNTAYVNLPAGVKISGGTNRTYTAWVNVPGNAGDGDVYGEGDGTNLASFWMRINTLNVAGMSYGNNTSNVALSANTWTFVYLRYNSGTITCGKIVSGTKTEVSASWTLNVTTTASPKIGRNPYAVDAGFDGLIDQVSIWNRALSDAELIEIENSGSGLAYASWDAASSAIKTKNGLAYASIKTFNSLAIASTKTVNGLA